MLPTKFGKETGLARLLHAFCLFSSMKLWLVISHACAYVISCPPHPSLCQPCHCCPSLCPLKVKRFLVLYFPVNVTFTRFTEKQRPSCSKAACDSPMHPFLASVCATEIFFSLNVGGLLDHSCGSGLRHSPPR